MKYTFISLAMALITISHNNPLLSADPNQNPGPLLNAMAVSYGVPLAGNLNIDVTDQEAQKIFQHRLGHNKKLTGKQWKNVERIFSSQNSSQGRTLRAQERLAKKLARQKAQNS